MLIIIFLEIVFYFGSLISSYLTWGPKTTSDEMVDYFGPPIRTDRKLTEEEMRERKRKAGFSAETMRALLITVLGLIVIPFYSASVDVLSILYSPFFRWVFCVVLIFCSVWSIYVGPSIFCRKDQEKKVKEGKLKEEEIVKLDFWGKKYKEHKKIYLIPYWCWWPYPVFIFGGVGVLTFMMVINSVVSDLSNLQSYSSSIDNILRAMTDVEHVQYALVRLIGFGSLVSATSQKYILTTLLIFLYVIIEQRSSMRWTYLDNSVERLKYVVWVVLVFTIGLSIIVLPSQYQMFHSRLQKEVQKVSFDYVYPDHLSDVLSIQKSLDDHDLKWVFLEIVTGPGNLLTLAIVSLSVFVWQNYIKGKVPPRTLLRLIVPLYIADRIDRFAEGFSVDMHFENEHLTGRDP